VGLPARIGDRFWRNFMPPKIFSRLGEL
jgi:hypothetical protein